jgi:hypothetical protein
VATAVARQISSSCGVAEDFHFRVRVDGVLDLSEDLPGDHVTKMVFAAGAVPVGERVVPS